MPRIQGLQIKKKGYRAFGSDPGKPAWRERSSQTSDFGCLRQGWLPGHELAWEAAIQTGRRQSSHSKRKQNAWKVIIIYTKVNRMASTVEIT